VETRSAIASDRLRRSNGTRTLCSDHLREDPEPDFASLDGRDEDNSDNSHTEGLEILQWQELREAREKIFVEHFVEAPNAPLFSWLSNYLADREDLHDAGFSMQDVFCVACDALCNERFQLPGRGMSSVPDDEAGLKILIDGIVADLVHDYGWQLRSTTKEAQDPDGLLNDRSDNSPARL
jgi:hypothetical protein